MHKLRNRCEENHTNAPRFHLGRIRGILRSSPAKSGLGLDMWVLRLLGTLPDEALSILLDIIHLAFRGKIPMQLLLVLIRLISKSDCPKAPVIGGTEKLQAIGTLQLKTHPALGQRSPEHSNLKLQ